MYIFFLLYFLCHDNIKIIFLIKHFKNFSILSEIIIIPKKIIVIRFQLHLIIIRKIITFILNRKLWILTNTQKKKICFRIFKLFKII